MPGIGPFRWIDPAQVSKPSLKDYFTLGVQRCRNAFSGLGRPNIKLISAKIEVVLNKPQPGLNEKEAVRVKMAKNCLTALVNGEDTLCDKLNRLHELAAETVGETNVRTALISATESISKDGLILLRDRTAHAYRLLGEKARTGVEGRVLRTLHKQLNHRLSAEKGLLPKGLHSTKSREYQIGRAGLHDHTQKAQAEGGTVGRFNYLSKKEADILAIQKVVCSALDDTVFDEDACDNVISGSKALVDSYRNNKAALRQAMVKAFAEEKFKPDLAKYAIDSIGTAGKSIEAEASKQKDSSANRQIMRRARILILVHDAYYMSQGQDTTKLRNDGTRNPTYSKLVEEYNETVEKKAELKEIPFADPASFVSAGIFNQFSFFGFLTGSSLRFLTVNLLNLSTSVTVDQRRGLFAKQLRGMSKGDLRDLHAPLQYYRAMLDGVIAGAGRREQNAARSLKKTLDVLFEEFSREWNRRDLPVQTVEKRVVAPDHIQRLGELLGPPDKDTGEDKGKEREIG